MTYNETINYLYSRLPMFTRVGASAFKKDLTNTLALCAGLDDPHKKFKSIHIGGTNGKGSTSHMLAAVLQTAGYKTGLYTSPHLKDFRERTRINGQMISEQEVIDFVAQNKQAFEEIEPSFFEMTVALAFDCFARHEVDIAVVEVGLGGVFDSTNVISPLLSIITNIGWDHMNLLGNTLPKIASQKAGIIKPNTPVIIGEYNTEVADVFIEKAKKENAYIAFASEQWEIERQEPGDKNQEATQLATITATSTHNPQPTTHNLQLDLTGTYQLKNVRNVLSAVEELRKQGFVITDEHIAEALKQVKHLTGLQGRWYTLSTNPLTICDTGHNPDGIEEVLKNIAAVKYEHLHFVIGMVNDKDITKVLSLLPKEATYYFSKPDMPRGLDASSLKEQAEVIGLHGEAYASVPEALKAAQQAAGSNDLVFAGGSTFVVAEIV